MLAGRHSIAQTGLTFSVRLRDCPSDEIRPSILSLTLYLGASCSSHVLFDVAAGALRVTCATRTGCGAVYEGAIVETQGCHQVGLTVPDTMMTTVWWQRSCIRVTGSGSNCVNEESWPANTEAETEERVHYMLRTGGLYHERPRTTTSEKGEGSPDLVLRTSSDRECVSPLSNIIPPQRTSFTSD